MYLASYTHPILYLCSKLVFWQDKFFNNSINITFTLCITQYLLLNTFSFSWDVPTYQLDFSVFWLSLKQLNLLCHLSSPPILFSVSEFRITVIVWMLRLLVIVNKVKHMALHGSHASQIKSWKTFVTYTSSDVTNKIRLILVTRFLGNES